VSKRLAVGLFFSLFLALAAAGLTKLPGPYGDNARYIINAQSLLQGKGFAKLNFPGDPPDEKVAPGYPVFLAAVARVTGFDMIALRLSSVVCMTAALLLFYAFLRRLGMRDDLAILALFFAGLNPVILEYGREVLSEALFCACVWAALYLFVRYEKQESAGFFLGGCFAAIMSFTVREAGFLILVAALAAAVLRRHRALAVFAAACCGVLAWIWFGRNLGVSSGYLAEFMGRGDYVHPASGTVSVFGLAKRAAYESAAYIGDIVPEVFLPFLKNILPHTRFWFIKIAAGAAISGCIVAGFVYLFRATRTRIWAFFLAAFCACLPFFPTYGNRYLVPVLPLLTCCLLYFLREAAHARNVQRYFLMIPAVFLIVFGWSAAGDIIFIRQGYPGQWGNYYSGLEYLKGVSAPGDIIVCRSPFLGYIVSGRKTLAYPYDRDKDRMADYLVNSGARFVVMDGLDIAGITFGKEFLSPALEGYPEYFTLLECWHGPETCVYEISGKKVSR